jgi:DNA-binding transcriptional ArsR family regulator
MDEELLKLAQQQSAICRLFGNPNRVLILWTLAQRECSVSEIAAAIDASLQNTSQHLHLMQAQGILESRRQGNTILYRLKHDSMHGCRLLLIAENAVPVRNKGVKCDGNH